MKTRVIRILLFVAGIVMLSSCLGGGGDSDKHPPPAPGSSNWDTMVWDQGNWG